MTEAEKTETKAETQPPKKKTKSYGERKIPDEFPDIPGLEFGECVGSGFFSHVYKGSFRGNPAAIKLVERGNFKLTMKEIDFLKQLKDVDDVVQLYAAFKTENMILVFEYIKSCSSENFYKHLTIPRLRFFIKHVLNALKGAHGCNIVHRDVKFANVLVGSHFDRVSLIDWGCASFITESMSSCAGSRTCRSPEMLMGYRNYGTCGDVWAVGTMIVDILTEGNLPWRKGTSQDILVTLSKFFGSSGFEAISSRYHLSIDDKVKEKMKETPIKNLEDCFTERMKPLYTPKLKDLLTNLLQIDPEKRITVAQAMKSKYFFGKRKKTSKPSTPKPAPEPKKSKPSK